MQPTKANILKSSNEKRRRKQIVNTFKCYASEVMRIRDRVLSRVELGRKKIGLQLRETLVDEIKRSKLTGMVALDVYKFLLDSLAQFNGDLLEVKRGRRSFESLKMPVESSKFYASSKWKEVRYQALLRSKGHCECCGARAGETVTLHVDHIKPRSLYPQLGYELHNLQVLCDACNLGKSNVDETDWRDSVRIA